MDYSYSNGGPRHRYDCDCYNCNSDSSEFDDEEEESEHSESSESVDELATAEKVYICDYDKTYISMYESIEKYRSAKLAKKKNISSIWNDLPVFLPNGLKTDIKTAPSKLFDKDIKKTADKVKSNNSIQSQPVITNNHNNSHSSTTELITPKKEKESPQSNKVEKVSKKKLKKLRQKEKKDQQTAKQIEKNNRKVAQKLEELNKSKILEKEDPKKENLIQNNKSVDNNEKAQEKKENVKVVNNKSGVNNKKKQEEIETGDDILDQNTPFISNALKKSEKKKVSERKEEKIKKPVTKPILVKEPVIVKPEPVIVIKKEPVKSTPTPNLPSTSGLASNIAPTVKKPTKIITANDIVDSKALGQHAVSLLINNQITQALQFFNEAINLNSHDIRHFLNRCYCFLRTGQFTQALEDAKFVIRTSRENEHLVTAKFRAGQAYCGLQNYQEAEKYLEEAYNFSQADSVIHQELLRVKVLQLVSMGFPERDVLETLFHCPSVEGAISLLAEKTITDDDGDYIYRNENDPDIYNSDDEENPSLTRLFVKLSTYQQGFMKKVTAPSPSPAKPIYIQPPKVQPKIITAIAPKVPINPRDINEKAIWVGNTPPEVTKQMLEKLFSKYGNVISVGRKPNETYSFVNFDNAKTVRELLTNNPFIEYKNIKMPIKPAKVNKPK